MKRRAAAPRARRPLLRIPAAEIAAERSSSPRRPRGDHRFLHVGPAKRLPGPRGRLSLRADVHSVVSWDEPLTFPSAGPPRRGPSTAYASRSNADSPCYRRCGDRPRRRNRWSRAPRQHDGQSLKSAAPATSTPPCAEPFCDQRDRSNVAASRVCCRSRRPSAREEGLSTLKKLPRASSWFSASTAIVARHSHACAFSASVSRVFARLSRLS